MVNVATCDSTWNYDLWIKCEFGRKFPISPCFKYKVTSVRCVKVFYWSNVQSYLTYGKTACWPCLCAVLWHHSKSHFICRFSLPQDFAGSCFDQLVSRIVTINRSRSNHTCCNAGHTWHKQFVTPIFLDTLSRYSCRYPRLAASSTLKRYKVPWNGSLEIRKKQNVDGVKVWWLNRTSCTVGNGGLWMLWCLWRLWLYITLTWYDRQYMMENRAGASLYLLELS